MYWGKVIIFNLVHAGIGFAQVPLQNYFQDLTGEIDKALASNGTSIDIHDVDNGRHGNNLVYYSTGLLLNEINELAPVVQLLNKSSYAKTSAVILSLSYTKQGQFDWRRVHDVFYDLSTNVTQTLSEFLGNKLHSVVLNWTTSSCQDAANFFSTTALHHGFGFQETLLTTPNAIGSNPYVFPKYVKNFFNFYCGTRNNCSSPPVGIAYDLVQVNNCSSGYLTDQVKAADFVTIPIAFSTDATMPVSYVAFEKHMKWLESQQDEFLGEKFNKSIIYKVGVSHSPVVRGQALRIWQGAWSDLESLIALSEHFNSAVAQRLKVGHSTSIAFLLEFFMKYCENQVKCQVVFDSEIVTLGESFKLESKSNLIQEWYTTEINETACSLLKSIENISRNDRIVINVGTWRALLRYRKDLHRNDNCQESAGSKNSFLNETKAILIVERDLLRIWDYSEAHFLKMLTKSRTVAGVKVDVVVIPEEFVNDQTTKFLKLVRSEQNLSVGCEVQLNEAKLEVLKLKMVFSEGADFAKFMMTLGGEMFEMSTVLVWNLEGIVDPVKLELIVLTKQVFSLEFPEKEIFLKLSNELSPEFVRGWAKFYNVTVIY